LASKLDEDSLRWAEQALEVKLKQLKAEGVNMVMMGINIHQPVLHKLAYKQAFHAWYGYVFMRHQGPLPKPITLNKRIIEMEDFEEYMMVMSECFVEMRQAMDIKPYPVIEALWRDSTFKENNKEEWFRHRDQTWMYFDGDVWVGSGLLYKEDLDDVFVPLSQQGKGYGRAIVEDLIREAYQRNIIPYIGYVKWNQRAGHLYQSLGFQSYLEVQYYRRFLKA
jgi:GNAT superfamily N-acetyltransferase